MNTHEALTEIETRIRAGSIRDISEALDAYMALMNVGDGVIDGNIIIKIGDMVTHLAPSDFYEEGYEEYSSEYWSEDYDDPY